MSAEPSVAPRVMWHGRVADCRSCRWGGLRRNRRGTSGSCSRAPAYPSPSTSVRFCRIGHSCNLRCREPDYPRNRTNSRVNHPIRRCHTSRIGSQVHASRIHTAHASRTSTARRRAHVAHDQIIQRHTEHVAKHQQLVINVAFHATILRLYCDSQPNLRRNRQLRGAKLTSLVFYGNRKTLGIPTIPRVSNGADDGSRNRLLRRHHQRIDVPKTVRLLMNRIKDEHPELQKTGKVREGAGYHQLAQRQTHSGRPIQTGQVRRCF